MNPDTHRRRQKAKEPSAPKQGRLTVWGVGVGPWPVRQHLRLWPCRINGGGGGERDPRFVPPPSIAAPSMAMSPANGCGLCFPDLPFRGGRDPAKIDIYTFVPPDRHFGALHRTAPLNKCNCPRRQRCFYLIWCLPKCDQIISQTVSLIVWVGC